jgi:signal peptidase I
VIKPFVAALLILTSTVAAIRALRRRYYRVEVAGESMRPSLSPGDFLVMRRGVPPSGQLEAGSIVALRDATGRLILKRVIGLPGESLRVGSSVLINRRPLIEPYAVGESPQNQFRGANQLPQDEYFVIGDNRAASTDSRDFGAVLRDRVEGVAVARYWPAPRAGRLSHPPRQFGEPAADPDLPLGMIRQRSSS